MKNFSDFLDGLEKARKDGVITPFEALVEAIEKERNEAELFLIELSAFPDEKSGVPRQGLVVGLTKTKIMAHDHQTMIYVRQSILDENVYPRLITIAREMYRALEAIKERATKGDETTTELECHHLAEDTLAKVNSIALGNKQ